MRERREEMMELNVVFLCGIPVGFYVSVRRLRVERREEMMELQWVFLCGISVGSFLCLFLLACMVSVEV